MLAVLFCVSLVAGLELVLPMPLRYLTIAGSNSCTAPIFVASAASHSHCSVSSVHAGHQHCSSFTLGADTSRKDRSHDACLLRVKGVLVGHELLLLVAVVQQPLSLKDRHRLQGGSMLPCLA